MYQIQPWAQVAQYETNTWPTTSSSLLLLFDHLDMTASGIDDLGPIQVSLPTPTPRLHLLSDTLTKLFDESASSAPYPVRRNC
jgi:hypothetical protein